MSESDYPLPEKKQPCTLNFKDQLNMHVEQHKCVYNVHEYE